jgi:hypothetical protein
VVQARANRTALLQPVELAPVERVADGRWRAAADIDPFDIPIDEKAALLLAATGRRSASTVPRFVDMSVSFLREEKSFASGRRLDARGAHLARRGGAGRSRARARSSTLPLILGIGGQRNTSVVPTGSGMSRSPRASSG